MMRRRYAPGGPPTRRDLASDRATPFSIEQHFVLQPILSFPIPHALLLQSLLYNTHIGLEPPHTAYTQ